MTVTLLTVIIFLILGLVVFKASAKGKGQGMVRSAIDFTAVLFSLIIGSLLSSLVFAKSIGGNLIARFDFDGMIAELSSSIGGSFETLLSALATMVVSSVIFIFVYFMVLLICKVIIAVLYRTVLKADPNDLGYINENAPWFVRNDKTLGAVIGGISGFMAVVIVCAPIIGTLKMADKVIDIVKVFSADTVEDMELDVVEDYADDMGVTVLYYCGSKTVYDLGARTIIEGNTVVLSKEINTVASMSYDIKHLIDNVGEFDKVGANDFRAVRDVCDKISDSYFLSVLAADCVSGASNKWLKDEAFMGMDFPVSNSTLDLMFDSILGVFAGTTHRTVSNDVTTFVDICILLIDSGLTEIGDDYNGVMEILDKGDIVNRLNAILEKNPRMASVTDALYRTAMKTLMKTIKFDGYNISEYDGLIENITGQFNRLQGQKTEKKIETLTDYAVQYMTDYGVDVPESVAEMVVTKMVENIAPDENGYVDAGDVKSFLEEYYQSGNSSGVPDIGDYYG